MPNVCYNELTVKGPKEEIDRFLEAAIGKPVPPQAEGMPLSLQSLFPMPARLDAIDPVGPYDEGENWYTWRVENWGTKWDVMETSVFRRIDAGEACIAFGTAWSPPEKAFTKRIALDFPKLTFVLHFDEPGMGFAGEREWRGGTLTRSEECEL